MKKPQLLAMLHGIKLEYNPEREISEGGDIVNELEEISVKPDLKPEELVQAFKEMPETGEHNEFQVIQLRTKAHSKKHFITYADFDACCRKHFYLTPSDIARLNQAMKKAKWETGKFGDTNVWRHD